MSFTKAIATLPSAVSIALNPISTGKTLPSLRRACRLSPMPMACWRSNGCAAPHAPRETLLAPAVPSAAPPVRGAVTEHRVHTAIHKNDLPVRVRRNHRLWGGGKQRADSELTGLQRDLSASLRSVIFEWVITAPPSALFSCDTFMRNQRYRVADWQGYSSWKKVRRPCNTS